MFRPATKQDRPGITALWGEAFGDAKEAVDDFFAAFPHCRSYVAEEDGRVVCMVHALPQILRAQTDVPAAYLYAVATAKEFRGQGLCSRLMAFAEADLQKNGFVCAVLTPGEQSLFEFYEKLGYETAFTRGHTTFSGGREISVAEYAALREGGLTAPHMVYDENTLAYARRVYGLRFYETADGCAAVSDTETAEVLPADCGGAPYAMVKWLGVQKTLKNAYLGFSLG